MRTPLRFRLPLAVAVASLGLVGTPGAATAARVIAPPGNSGVGQYVEVVPGAGGSLPVGAGGNHAPVLSPSARKRLEAAGSSGKALAAFAQRTGVPQSKHATPSVSDRGQTRAKRGHVASPAYIATPARSTSASAGGGLGSGLYIALGAILLAGLGLFAVRRRAT